MPRIPSLTYFAQTVVRAGTVALGVPGFLLLPLSRESADGRLNWAGHVSHKLLAIAKKGAESLRELNLKRAAELPPDKALVQYERYIDNPRDTRQLIALALQATSKDLSSTRRESLLAQTKGCYYFEDDAGWRDDLAQAKATREPTIKSSIPKP